MLSNSFGLLYTSEYNMRLKDLTLQRTVASVPFGGRYRVIDFPMSNLVNSGVTSIGVLTQRNYSSLMDHLSSGGEWDLNRKRDGLFVLPPFVAGATSGVYRGTVDGFKNAQDYMSHTPFKYCIFMEAHSVFNIDLNDAMRQHLETRADITLIYNIEKPNNTAPSPEKVDDIRLILSENSRISDMEIDLRYSRSHNAYMGCFIIDKQLLEYLINDASSRGYVDFVREVVFKRLDTMHICGYRFDGYVARMTDVGAFFRANLDLLKPDVRHELFDLENRIYTKVKDEVPALYRSSAIVKNSMVADGCIIEGSIEGCILGRGVRIYRGAQLKNCVIMQGGEIQENAHLENAILDKEVMVRRNTNLIGTERFPIVVRKQSVI